MIRDMYSADDDYWDGWLWYDHWQSTDNWSLWVLIHIYRNIYLQHHELQTYYFIKVYMSYVPQVRLAGHHSWSQDRFESYHGSSFPLFLFSLFSFSVFDAFLLLLYSLLSYCVLYYLCQSVYSNICFIINF